MNLTQQGLSERSGVPLATLRKFEQKSIISLESFLKLQMVLSGLEKIVKSIEKNEIAFLSANTWDVSGGGNYGYSSIWVNRNNNIFDNLDYKPKNEIKNLKQLLDII